MPDNEYYSLIWTLNERQYVLIIHVLSCFKLGDTPMHVFVDRPAGYGKSVVIKAFYKLWQELMKQDYLIQMNQQYYW
jgi:hypothetical protein